MTRHHWIIPMVLLATTAAVFPARADARSCVRDYQRCLNDTWDTRGFTRLLADVECLAGYIGCVRRKL